MSRRGHRRMALSLFLAACGEVPSHPATITIGPIQTPEAERPGMNSCLLEGVVPSRTDGLHLLSRDFERGRWRVFYRHVSLAPQPLPTQTLVLETYGDALDAVLTASGDTVHALWSRAGENGVTVHSNRSLDGGFSWLSSAVALDPPARGVFAPVIACDDRGTVVACWLAWVAGGLEVRVNRSLDHGESWNQAALLLPGSSSPDGFLTPPSLTCGAGGTSLVAFTDRRAGRRRAFVQRSTDRGSTWSSPRILEEGVGDLLSIHCLALGEEFLAFSSFERGSPSLVRSADGGSTWDRPFSLSPDGEDLERIQSVVANDGILHAVSLVSKGPAFDQCTPVVSTSLDGGLTWKRQAFGPPVPLMDPSECTLAVVGDETWLAWTRTVATFPEVVLARADLRATNWSAPVRIEKGAPARSSSPWLVPTATDAGALLWEDRDRGEGAPAISISRISADAGPSSSVEPPPPAPDLRSDTRDPLPIADRASPREEAHEESPFPSDHAPDTGVAPRVLANDEVAFHFAREGTSLTLEACSLRAYGDQLPLARGSGGWRLEFRRRSAPTLSHFVAMDGSGTMALELTSVESEERLLRGAWEGQACVDQEEFGFRVDSEWRLPAQGPFVETRLRVRFDTNADVYLSEILHPLVYVRPIDATDLLVLPALGGYLLEDPIRNPRCLKAFGTRFPWLTVPFLAYYGARSQLCFLYGDDDHQETWLPHNVYVVPEREELCFSTRHVPPNVFQTRSFTTPYRIRVGATKGDWIDAAQLYRERMRAECAWYAGPLGSDANPSPGFLKDCAYTVTFSRHESRLDCLDELVKELSFARPQFGSEPYVRLYGAHSPARMDVFYDLDYLPGVPTFRAAVRESQLRGAVVAPYVNSSCAYDARRDPGRSSPLTERQRSILAAAAVREDGSLFESPIKLPNVVMCNGSAWWQDTFVSECARILEFSGAGGLYCDYFGTSLCYSERHGHAPGGGTYPWRSRIDQFRRIRSAARATGRESLVISMEALHGRMTEECNLMHNFPCTNPFKWTNARSIPFFRFVYDNVKLSRHGTARFKEELDSTELSAWDLANEVFAFGQVPVHQEFFEEGGLAWCGSGRLPYFDYLGRITRFLASGGFTKWHSGTMVRPPQLREHGAEDLQRHLRTPGQTARTVPAVFDAALVTGMFRAPDGSFAYVLTNPWIGGGGHAVTFEALVDPQRHELFPEVFSYHSLGNDERTLHTGRLSLVGEAAPAEILCWVFENADGGSPESR